MIIAALEELYKQIPESLRLKQALDYIAGARGQALADGRYEIQGQELYALPQSYQTIPAEENTKFEAHRRYIDVQYIVDGVEVMGWAPLSQMLVSAPYNPDKDVILGTCPSALWTPVKVAAGQAAIFFPEDAHAPKLAAGEPCPVKKIVVKVLI
jgi:biofilm protein TabA